MRQTTRSTAVPIAARPHNTAGISIEPPSYQVAMADRETVKADDAPVQGVFGLSAQQNAPFIPNNTGLPDQLKTGIEQLSGYAMDDVKVYYNSSKPATLRAHAYAQGTDIHIASGQEKHLPHEAWHIVQQKQGRVKPTLQMQGGVNVNDDKGLEKEADVMGEAAARAAHAFRQVVGPDPMPANVSQPTVQRYWDVDNERGLAVWYNEEQFTWSNHPQTDRLMRTGHLRLIVNGEVVYDPRAGQRPRQGGGFALGGGYSASATFQTPWGSQGMGMPGAAQPGMSEIIDYGLFAVTHQGVTPQQFGPAAAGAAVQLPPVGLPSLPSDLTSSFVTQDVIASFEGRRSDTTTFPTQRPVMGGMSAQQGIQWSGAPMPPGQIDWMHRHRFAHGGVDHVQPQTPSNFTAGTHGANIRHLILEDAVSHGTSMTGVVPVSTQVENPISPAHHVYGQLDYTWHSPYDPSISQTSRIDLMNPQMPRRTDQQFANFNMDVFQSWATIHELIQSGDMNPTDMGPNGEMQYQAWLEEQHQ